ncbi:glycosyltransferase [Paenibacillus oryzisoli]|uniref:MGDG synthase family glycosyltransferase n=1 Tax=Paenibacillus oryzisoli TaxID=1850517 RepID=UPI003D2E50BA
MNANPRILILTASYGNGHLQASKALYQQFLSQGIEHVRVVNLMKEGHPFIHLLTTKLIDTSLKSSRFGLDYYGWCYYLTREKKQTALFQKSMIYLGQKKLRELIEQERPDVVINTFPFGAAPEICRSMGIQNVTILTDYALHASWLHANVDTYYVATEELKRQLVFRGVSRERVKVSGIPIRQEFAQSKQGQGADSPARKMLIMAADAGVNSYMEELLLELSVIPGCELNVVCGYNHKLQKRLAEQFSEHPRITVHGYVETMQRMMAEACCILTKAGGLTLTEALVSKLPIFVYKPHAGQEKENARYLVSRGVASISNSQEELVGNITYYFAHPEIASDVQERMEALQRSHASLHIVSDILYRCVQKGMSISI